jgi:Mn-dependent transcriptional regulator
MYESGENYLKTILILKNRNGYVRSIDIAREMNFSKPSVSRAVGILKSKGYIDVEEGGAICLTKKGKAEAENIYERHKLLTEFIIKITSVNSKIAEVDACKMEHILSEEVYNGIKDFMKIVEP